MTGEEVHRLRTCCARAALVLEHADTFRGHADLRPLLRHAVEALGGRLVGTPAREAHVADDKIEAQRRLRGAGLSVPPSVLLDGEGGRAVRRFPAVVKRPYHHGSRGIALVSSARELHALARRWHLEASGPLLVEEYVEGRELAVSVVEVHGRAACLPIVEVDLKGCATYGRRAKWGNSPLSLELADLRPADSRRIARRALRAFRVLGLRDYARFDLRFREGGEPVFLEANVRPSVEDGTEFRLAAASAGLLGADLVALILDGAARRHGWGSLGARAARVASRASRAVRDASILSEGRGLPSARGPRRRAPA